MTKRSIHICQFDSAEHLRGRARTYDAVKAAVLAAGRFSCFEASASEANGRLFTLLCRDPELETFQLGFPWVGVRRKVTP